MKIKLTCVLLSVILLLSACTSTPYLDYDECPSYTQELLDRNGRIASIDLDDNKLILLLDDESYVYSSDYLSASGYSTDNEFFTVQIDCYSNPTLFEEEVLHPFREFIDDNINLPTDMNERVDTLCAQPVVTETDVALADGCVYKVKHYSYVLDYNSISPILPTVVLPVQRYVFNVDNQQRLCLTFVYNSYLPKYTASDLLTIVDIPGYMSTIPEMGMYLCDKNDLLTAQSLLFIRRIFFTEDILNVD